MPASPTKPHAFGGLRALQASAPWGIGVAVRRSGGSQRSLFAPLIWSAMRAIDARDVAIPLAFLGDGSQLRAGLRAV
jgi:hypothetical protein